MIVVAVVVFVDVFVVVPVITVTVSSAIQTLLGPSSLLEEWSKTPHCSCYFLCVRLPPKMGETAKVYK